MGFRLRGAPRPRVSRGRGVDAAACLLNPRTFFIAAMMVASDLESSSTAAARVRLPSSLRSFATVLASASSAMIASSRAFALAFALSAMNASAREDLERVGATAAVAAVPLRFFAPPPPPGGGR